MNPFFVNEYVDNGGVIRENQEALEIGMKMSRINPLIFRTEKTANGETYNAYSLLGDVRDQDGTDYQVNLSLGHLVRSGFVKVTITDEDGNVVTPDELDNYEATATRSENIKQVTGIAINVEITDDNPQKFLFLASTNPNTGEATERIYSMLGQGRVAKVGTLASLKARLGSTNLVAKTQAATQA